VKRRNEDNIITRLKLIFFFAFKFPIGIVDEDKNTGPPGL
jgi:hypothetical protein